MTSIRSLTKLLVASMTLGAGTLAVAAAPALAKSVSGASAVKMIDTDSDGTVDMKEVEAVASSTFDRLEKDSDEAI